MIITDSKRDTVAKQLDVLAEKGVKYAYCESLSAISVAMEKGFSVIAGARANAYNSHTVRTLAKMGVEGVVLSHELTSPQKRDIVKSLPVGEVVWGKAPLMIMENCIMNLRDSCRDCSDWRKCNKHTELTDRKGITFPVYPEYFHRCQIYNSATTCNTDKITLGTSFGIYFITDEKSIDEALIGNLPKNYTRKG